ncbi:hypothetical protein ADIMK_3834 [Marinobacterium lacunae]|uniref:FecR protein domain-containing protein n=1 Tax=Marinobacterium lacunae TaxID=1232683 RepID=A0A081FUG8_9GAMM|nr:FecR domain-containing protein [Marinobacterium lacunae]KEA62173.1 hypothetical protein ADIMK_3834 [Marinobacterium lacunae]MBR9885765.1 hypothetical protein [Oceanospirillales bacterium]
MFSCLRKTVIILALTLPTLFAHADEASIGTIKTLKGSASIERDGQTVEATLGQEVYSQDSIQTGTDGAIGLLFLDDSRVAIGPNSRIALDRFSFDRNTHDGDFNLSMKQGTLSAIAGKLTEKKPGAMTVKTPSAILAVRGTEFSVKVSPKE